jgi:integrase/recombinase XerD
MKTAAAVEAFIASRRARGCSASYERWLRYTLGKLAAAYEELPTAPEQVEAVLAGLEGVSGRTRFDVWSATRWFYRWAAARLNVPDAARVVQPPLRRRKLLRTLTEQEVDRLLGSRLSRRDRALVQLLLDTGMRIGEAASLTWATVGPSVVRVCGKTGERDVPICPGTAQALLGLGDGRVLWVGKRGPIDVRGLQQAVKRALARAGLGGGPHLLRHTFGRLYIMAGGDVFSLQRIMGHQSISSTRIYVDMDLGDTRVQHAQFSPIARRAAR